jgi:hypothetical protein
VTGRASEAASEQEEQNYKTAFHYYDADQFIV